MKSFFIFLLLALTIAGCSQHAGDGGDGRVAASVNGVEITQREVDFLYQRTSTPGASESVKRDQRRNILAGLVRAELLAQQAVKMKLDQSPEFPIALYNARRGVLAGLAESKIVSTAKPLSQETIQTVVEENPNLFAQRKLLVYEEVIIQGVNVPFLESLNASAGKGASLTALLDEVKAKTIPFRRTTRTLTSDQIEPAILKILSTARANVPVVMRVADKFSMMLMLHTVVPIPLEGQAAEQAAANLINARQRNIAFSQKMTDVVDDAKISYFGEFKPDAPGSKGKQQTVALPTPDPARATSKLYRQIRFAALLTFSFTVAMLILTVSMLILRGKLWVPRLWPTRKKESPEFDYHDYQASLLVELTLILIAISTLSALGYLLYLLWHTIPFWMMLVAAISGMVVGTGVSRLFALQQVQRFTQKYSWVTVSLFCLFLGGTVLGTNLIHGKQQNITFSITTPTVDAFRKRAPEAKSKPKTITQPAPLPASPATKPALQIRLAALLLFSCTVAMLLLTASMQILQRTLWLPRLWPARKKETQNTLDYNDYLPSLLLEFKLLLIGILAILALCYQLYLLWGTIPFWMMLVAIVSGMFTGTGTSRLFALQRIQHFTNRFRWAPVLFFGLLLAVIVLGTMRIVN